MERIVIYLVLLNACFDINIAFTSKHTMERLDYIEDRLNTESKFRREGFNALFDKVEGIETMLKNLLEKKETQVVPSEDSEKSMADIASNKMIAILSKSFKAEKLENIRFKREIVHDVNRQAEHMKEAYERVENSLYDITKKIGQLEQKTHHHNIDSDKLAGQVMQRLEENARNTTSLLKSTMHNTETILVALNGTGELIKDQVHLNEILQTLLENYTYECHNSTGGLTKKLENREQIKNESNLDSNNGESCLDLFNKGLHSDGIYKIRTGPAKTDMSVYCDMTTDGGGWTVFQRRQDGSEDFRRDWNDYKYGFGKLDGEFWLGNEYINLLTDDGKMHELRIDLEDYEGDRAYAKYNKFKIGSESTNYILEVSGYTGNAGDSLQVQDNQYHNHNGMQFSTKDRDNDLRSDNCASIYNGAWWFNSCFSSNLNGVHNKQKKCTSWSPCIVWSKWKGFSNTVKFSEMKLR